MSYVTTPAAISNMERIDENVRANRTRRAAIAEQSKASNDKKFAIIMAIVAAILAIGVIAVHGALDNARFERAYELPLVEVVVHEGDTIDGIAGEHPVDGLSDHELGYVISEINKGAHSVPLMPGDRLMVPVEPASN